jgi:hypothetical protein
MSIKKISTIFGTLFLAATAVFAGTKKNAHKFICLITVYATAGAGNCLTIKDGSGKCLFTGGTSGHTQATIRTANGGSRKIWTSCAAVTPVHFHF